MTIFQGLGESIQSVLDVVKAVSVNPYMQSLMTLVAASVTLMVMIN
ncbi:hypothetical protein [Helicobacter didelphidarum]|nr:hypothetical protein [Helicobacter didelphidarum]